MKHCKRKIVWDRDGVSEVIGTILTLSITVVLFSSIIVMVDQFPAPGDKPYTDFMATVEPRYGDWNEGAYIHITNTGGLVMTGEWTQIVLSIDSQTFMLRTKGTMPDDGGDYGVGLPGHRGSDNGDDNWDTGERWTVYRDNASINQNSDVSVMILDQGRNSLVWYSLIQGARNRFGPVISNIRIDSDLDSIRLDPIPYGRPFHIFADVYDPDGDLDYDSVYADLSSITLSSDVRMHHIGDGVFRSDPVMGPNTSVPIGYHIIMAHAEDHSGMRSSAPGRVAVGVDLKDQPNLVLLKKNIRLSSENPSNGDVVTFTVTVVNYGGKCNGTLSIFDVIDPVSNPDGTLISMAEFAVSDGPDQITSTISWQAAPGGRHTIRFEAWPVNAVDPTPEDNVYFHNLTVMPRILLVDDDNHPENFGPGDTASFMRGALDSCDFTYHYHRVLSGRDGPWYDIGGTKLADYDIVIWVTGYEKANTLTPVDRSSLTAYLNDDLGVGRAGSLWLVGQYIAEEQNGTAAGADFLRNVLKLDNWWPSAGGPGPDLLGVAGNPVSDEWENDTIPLITRFDGHGGGWRIQPRSDANVTFNRDNSTGHAINYENAALDSRLVFFPWEFSRIRDTGDQAQVAYRVMNWLGNLQNRTGDDLAISAQTIDPSFVFFNQKVNVTAVIRNNGPDEHTTQAGLFLVDENRLITETDSIVVPGDGGTVTVSGTWTADTLGSHVLKWKVDHNDLIQETNEANNEVPDHIHDGSVFVEFRILVVDDDSSGNNNGTLSNDTALLTGSLSRLDYMYESHNGVNTAYEVMDDDDGPDIDYLKDYSAVFWVGGDSPGALTDNDVASLRQYLADYQGRLWLSGNDLFGGLPAANRTSFLNFIGIADTVPDQPLSGTLLGVDDSGISHGMNISIASNPSADRLDPASGQDGVFRYPAGAFAAVKYELDNYHAISCGFNLGTLYGAEDGRITGDNATDELTFMLLRWMGRPETRNEVRITERDYFLNNWHPQIGDAYVLRARVHNVGANDANFLIRFMDGNVQIGSDTVSVSPGAMASAEMIWRPLFAGQREISILADPLGEVPEIFPWFNNNISFQIYVYFFWDDMESGPDRWTHASTVVNINGEGALDYYTGNAQVDIHKDWDYGLTYGLNNTTSSAHSHPSSYFMEEPVGDIIIYQDVDALVSIALDNSVSMSGRTYEGKTWMEHAKDAALILVDTLSNESMVGLWNYAGTNAVRVLYPTLLDETGRQTVVNAITAIASQPITSQWDACGGAYMDVKDYSVLYPELIPAVVLLADGADNQAADNQGGTLFLIESGSDEWAPWGPMEPELGYPIRNYPAGRFGKYQITYDLYTPWDDGRWLANGGAQYSANRRGLLYSDIKIFTIGLGLEHNDDIPNWNIRNTAPTHNTHDAFDLYVNPSDPDAIEAGTVEYNMWRIANTSGAEYFFTPDPGDLRDIFESIGRLIMNGTGGFNQTRSSPEAPASSPAQPGTRATNTDKWAATPAFSLVNVSKAEVSFWHRYKIRQGANGVYMEIGFWDGSAWGYRYIVPPGRYTGMLLHEQYSQTIEYDDFGNQIQWCWNGVSGKGLFTWDYVSFDMMPFVKEHLEYCDANGIPHPDLSQVVARFYYKQYGGGATGNGWYIDDLKIDVTRVENAAIGADTRDVWERVTETDRFGDANNTAWWNRIIPGNDNHLRTTPIDLTSARNATLSAYFKFNLNPDSDGGSPPNGFRVEISSDGGATWTALSMGLRTAGGLSGGTGVWVSAGSLTGLKVDLSAWRGGQIFIRFRMVSNNDQAIPAGPPRGFYVDDVQVTGDSIYG